MMRIRIVAMVALGIVLGGCSTGVGEGGLCRDVCAGTTAAREGTDPTEPGERTIAAAEAPSIRAGVFFPTLRNPSGAAPESISRGTLSLSEKGCLLIEPLPKFKKKFPRAMRGYPGTVPLWPSFFELDTGRGKVRVLEEHGRVVARVGKRVSMGGGEIGEETIRGNDLMSEWELSELSERCPDSYWFVGSNVHIPGQGD